VSAVRCTSVMSSTRELELSRGEEESREAHHNENR
jgi:hypothetical protein